MNTAIKIVVGVIGIFILLAVLVTMTGPGRQLMFRTYLSLNSPDEPFNPEHASAAPDYADVTNWAALPGTDDPADLIPEGLAVTDIQGDAPADVFFIHPTGYLGGESWTSSMDPDSAAEQNTRWMMAYQASAYNGCCNVYAPRYREATIFTYMGSSEQREEVLKFAYGDVERAFDYFISHFNEGRPFIIASHSQGSHHAKRLLKNRIDGTALHERMVAAYTIGSVVIEFPDEYFAGMSDIAPCESATDTGCVIHWDTAAEGSAGVEREKGSLCTNPLSWAVNNERVEADMNEGAVPIRVPYNTSGEPTGAVFDGLDSPIEGQTWAQCREGTLYVEDQAGGPFDGVGMDGNYHGLDYALFYMNIRNNAIKRVAQWQQAATAAPNPTRSAFFGDLHVHTVYSMDAYVFGTRATPDDAYRFARGDPLRHPGGFNMQLTEPLDFYAVTDHGFYLGILESMGRPGTPLSEHPDAAVLTQHKTVQDRGAAFQTLFKYLNEESPQFRTLLDEEVHEAAWQKIVDAANRHNAPGRFTTFVGYEYTSGPESQNLHRNVIFKGSEAPAAPFSRLDSANPEDLWAWMDDNREKGMESLAIPHNSNGSNGQMFSLDWFGTDKPIDAAYAELRMRNEPLVENTQVKGTSDTHPMLSPNDEWADFEIYPLRIASRLTSDINGSYVREALLNGIKLQESAGFNPFKFGLIGSSDTHNASWSGNDENYWSKVGLMDSNPVLRGSVPLLKPGPEGNRYRDVYYHLWGGSGLAAVWAEENTRDSIYNAFRRKETFSTTGPRIKVRFFAGATMPQLGSEGLVESAYADGVPMGGDLSVSGDQKPWFIAWAVRDTRSAPLQRLQIIKGWIEDGETKEQVFDVACSNGLTVNPETYRCPDNGASVDLTSCAFSEDTGAAELMARWQDPAFDHDQDAFYYVRVLQNPTCRWSTWDAVRTGVEPRPDLPATIQERAWSSPVWYSPGNRE